MNIRKTCLAVLTMAFVAACCPKPGSPTQAPASGGPPPAEAAGVASRDFGDYVVHFNALSTDQLTPEVAKSYNIVRSKNRALLNVSIVKKVPGTTGQSVPGSVVSVQALPARCRDYAALPSRSPCPPLPSLAAGRRD